MRLCREAFLEGGHDEDSLDSYLFFASQLATEDPRQQEAILAARILGAIHEAARFAAQYPHSRLARALSAPGWEAGLAVLAQEKKPTEKGRPPSLRARLANALSPQRVSDREAAALLLLVRHAQGELLARNAGSPRDVLRYEQNEIKKIREKERKTIEKQTTSGFENARANAEVPAFLPQIEPDPPLRSLTNAGFQRSSRPLFDDTSTDPEDQGLWEYWLMK